LQVDNIDAALSELEKMLNDEVFSPAADAGDVANDAVDNHTGHPQRTANVDCTQIPRLSARLHYVR